VQNPADTCIPLRELWEGFNPLGVREGTFVLFRGYMDESHDKENRLFALSCLIATGKDWYEMERAWKLQLAAKNKELKRAGRKLLTRYHASECSTLHGEYEGWDVAEQIEFVKGFFNIFKRTRGVHAVGYVVDLDDLCEVFPEWAKDRLETAYAILPKFVMYTIGDDFHNMAPTAPYKVTLFHDRTSGYDATILRAFESVKNESKHAEHFTTIAALGWDDCIALQPADLVAFEVFKEAQGKEAARQRRKSFSALLALDEFGIHTKAFTKDVLLQLRQKLEEDKAVGTTADR
jgi:hypothetical protein